MTAATLSATPRPIIATMIGDPAGVGPEVAVRALATGEPHALSRPMLIGSTDAVDLAIGNTQVRLRTRRIRAVSEARFDPDVIDVLDPGTLARADFTIGQAGAKSGVAVSQWLELATSFAERGDIQGWIMAPIDRTSLKLGVGMTDDEDTTPPGTYLFRTSGKLRIVPLSEHIRLRDVPATVTEDNVHALVSLVHATLTRWGMQRPRIALAGLNPHARGEEERDAIIPAAVRARNEGIDVVDPVSADAVFRQCLDGKYDIVISMYHDQGQVALKTTAFEGACSIYLGLPYVRLTVPHGSAFDIAGQGIAQHRSMLSAMVTAAKLAAGSYTAAD